MAVATDLDLTTGLAGNRALGPRPWHRRREDSANPFTVSPGTTRLYGLVALLLSVALSCIPLVRNRAATALPYEVFLRVGAVFSRRRCLPGGRRQRGRHGPADAGPGTEPPLRPELAGRLAGGPPMNGRHAGFLAATLR